MEAQELINMLKEHPDFDVQISLFEPDGSVGWGVGLRTFKVIGIGDTGHSDKIIQLDINDSAEGRDTKKTEQVKLYQHVEKFVKDLEISCPETVSQADRVIEAAYGFIEGCADIVGYHKYDDEL